MKYLAIIFISSGATFFWGQVVFCWPLLYLGFAFPLLFLYIYFLLEPVLVQFWLFASGGGEFFSSPALSLQLPQRQTGSCECGTFVWFLIYPYLLCFSESGGSTEALLTANAPLVSLLQRQNSDFIPQGVSLTFGKYTLLARSEIHSYDTFPLLPPLAPLDLNCFGQLIRLLFV